MYCNKKNIGRAPAAAAVYGGMRQSGACSEVRINLHSPSGSLVANVTAAWVDPKTWKALLPPTPAGNSFNVTVLCIKDAGQIASSITMGNVAFGDVILCSGQVDL